MSFIFIKQSKREEGGLVWLAKAKYLYLTLYRKSVLGPHSGDDLQGTDKTPPLLSVNALTSCSSCGWITGFPFFNSSVSASYCQKLPKGFWEI